MATSGRIEGSYGPSWANYVPYIKWSVTQSSADNRSAMSVTFGMRKTGANSQSYNGYPHTLTVTVDGSTYTRSISFDFRSAGYPTDHDIVTISGISIPHNADGTKAAAISASHPTDTGLGTGTLSGTAALDTIPRSSTMAVPAAMTMGTAYTFPISRADSGFTHRVSYAFGSASGTVAAGAGTSVSWTPPTSLGSQIPASVSGTVTLTLDTYSGGALIGTRTYTATLSVPSYTPTAALTVSLDNSASTVAAGWGVAVKGFTRLTWSVTAQSSCGAAIAAYSVSLAGQSGTTASGTTKALTVSGQITPTVTVRDSRGRTATVQAEAITVYDYGTPTIGSSHAYRCDASGDAASDGAYLNLLCRGEISSVGGRNAMTCRFRVRQTGGSWGGYTTLTDNVAETVSAGLSAASSYEVELGVADTLGGSRTVVCQIPTDRAAFHLRAGGQAAAFGKYAEHTGELELAESWDLRYHGAVMTDHVVEQGTSGDWTYRKWNSGLAECWLKTTATLTHYTAVNGWYGYYSANYSYPISFTSVPATFPAAKAGSGFAMSSDYSQERTYYRFYFLANVSGEQSCALSCYAVGRWK